MLISLGGNCSITYQLNKYNLRQEAYPFDWAKVSINQLITVLENGFKDYCQTIKIMKFSSNHDNTLLLKKSGPLKAFHLMHMLLCQQVVCLTLEQME